MRGQNLRQTSSSQTREQMGEVLFTSSMWTHQCSTEHRHCSRHAPVHESKPSPSAQNEHPLSSMRRSSPVTIWMLDPTTTVTSIRFHAQQILKSSSNTTHPQQICKSATQRVDTTTLALGRKTLSIPTLVCVFLPSKELYSNHNFMFYTHSSY